MQFMKSQKPQGFWLLADGAFVGRGKGFFLAKSLLLWFAAQTTIYPQNALFRKKTRVSYPAHPRWMRQGALPLDPAAF